MSSTCKPAISTSITLNQTMPMRFFASFRTLYSLDYTSVKTLTKIIFDLLQWQEIATLSLPKKAAIAPFISTTFPGHFCLRANDIARNRSRVIFSGACADIFRRWRWGLRTRWFRRCFADGLNQSSVSSVAQAADSLSCISDSKAQDLHFHKQKLPGFRFKNSL